jgi:pyrroloquinoline quinone biosynthesis protein D
MAAATDETIRAKDRPRLSAKARLRVDRVRGGDVLLYPEGLLLLSPTAAAVLALCDGQRDTAGVAAELAERYCAPAEQILADVTGFLTTLRDRGLVNISAAEPGGES